MIQSITWKASLCLYIILAVTTVEANVACSETSTCVKLLRNGSQCVDGFCTNPFINGCFRQLLGEDEFPTQRICNSHDDDNTGEKNCAKYPYNNYQEIRIWTANWESSMFTAWIMQILLSELLHVPVSIETGDPNKSMNFYDKNNSFHYAESLYDWKAIERANEYGDCREVKKKNPSESCAHVMPEVWSGQKAYIDSAETNGYIEPPSATGMLANSGWFIPRFTAERDPTLTTFLGFRGIKNRKKLAKMFKRPTTWKEYCTLVSTNGCAVDDGIAVRAPQNAHEEGKYFVHGLFLGYFRYTEKNNCIADPTNCTGHFSNAPCTWSIYTQPQIYYNNIALESDGPLQPNGGYDFTSLIEIWDAANATKSDVIMYWFYPDTTYQAYVGSDAEFSSVAFPAPNQECAAARVTEDERCSINVTEQVGSSLGACDTEGIIPLKIFSSNLHEDMNDINQPNDVAFRNPGYETLKSLRITELQIGQIFDYWHKNRTHHDDTYWSYEPREAVCEWMVENHDYLQSFIPRSYPHMWHKENRFQEPVFDAAFIIGIIMAVVATNTGLAIYRLRNTPAIRSAQLEFLFLLLIGLVCVSLGATCKALPPTHVSCVASIWLIEIGYTLELLPLTIKVAAINKMMSAAKKMKRVKISREQLHGCVVVGLIIIIVPLVVWTSTNSPSAQVEMTLTEQFTNNGERIVDVHDYCSSENMLWVYAGLCWQAILLISGAALAYQTREVREDFNESKTMGFIIYSHTMFYIMRIVTYLLEDKIDMSTIEATRSLVLSADAFVALIVYFFPRIHEGRKYRPPVSRFQNDIITFETDHQYGGEGGATALTSLTGNNTITAAANSNETVPNAAMDQEIKTGNPQYYINKIGHNVAPPEQIPLHYNQSNEMQRLNENTIGTIESMSNSEMKAYNTDVIHTKDVVTAEQDSLHHPERNEVVPLIEKMKNDEIYSSSEMKTKGNNSEESRTTIEHFTDETNSPSKDDGVPPTQQQQDANNASSNKTKNYEIYVLEDNESLRYKSYFQKLNSQI